MPLYDYRCAGCGPFRERRALAQAGEPAPCPTCGDPAPRAVVAARLATMDGARREAHRRNEKSAHEPQVVRRPREGSGHDHGGGGGGHGHRHRHPPKRPWMIGH